MSEVKRFAVLIDAENVPATRAAEIFDKISDLGALLFKRVYTDWTARVSEPWKKPILRYAMTPIQQFSYAKGKNSSDSALIIDAMDILYSGKTDGFIIVSNDSDFTRLAIRLRENGQTVVGVGGKSASHSLASACDLFIHLDAPRSADKSSPDRLSCVPDEVIEALAACLAESLKKDADGFAPLPEIAARLGNKIPGFNSKTYFGTKLHVMLKRTTRFELAWRKNADNKTHDYYLRDKEVKKEMPSGEPEPDIQTPAVKAEIQSAVIRKTALAKAEKALMLVRRKKGPGRGPRVRL